MLSFTDVKMEDTTLWTATSYANISGNGAKMGKRCKWAVQSISLRNNELHI